MKKTRVPKGEKYWYIGGLFDACIWTDDYTAISNKHFEYNNYFHTKEEAEVMSRKLRAVLKGADMIEMPSEEEIESVASKICHEIEKCGIISGHPISGHITSACKSMADFFNNRIVK